MENMQRARVNGVDIAYERVGSGAPLLVVGGPHLGHDYMRPLDAWVSEGCELIYYDHRGSGHTELSDPDKLTFSGAIEDLDGLRTHLGIDKLNLVGHSLGAVLSLMYAAKRPDTTASLILLNPGPPFVPNLMQEFQAAMTARRRPEDDAEMKAIMGSAEFANGDLAARERQLLNTFTPFFRDRASRDACRLGFTDVTAANAGAIGERLFRDLPQLDPIGSLSAISCPTLIVYSETDPIPEEYSRLLADKITSA